jgi:hypothetical protein
MQSMILALPLLNFFSGRRLQFRAKVLQDPFLLKAAV